MTVRVFAVASLVAVLLPGVVQAFRLAERAGRPEGLHYSSKLAAQEHDQPRAVLQRYCVTCHNGRVKAGGLLPEQLSGVVQAFRLAERSGRPEGLHYSSKLGAQEHDQPRAVLQRYCVTCHNGRVKAGGLLPDQLSGVVQAFRLADRAGRPEGLHYSSKLAAQEHDQSRAVLQRYCITCHNGRVKAGGLLLDQLDVDHPEQQPEPWEKVARKLRTGMMPPSGAPRPDAATLDRLAAHVEAGIDRAAALAHNPA